MGDHFVLLAKSIGDVRLQRCSRTLPRVKWHLFWRCWTFERTWWSWREELNLQAVVYKLDTRESETTQDELTHFVWALLGVRRPDRSHHSHAPLGSVARP